ncbi:hypothetical protein M409DRAFT_29692 [Zasmidium cellare ATCC 36951]|uniref:N-acetyltransferase domain-containing protein n=1 Tax=Zasmidium cellare ATCC 36951 TaxID=1080233 RepID=A0A6A6BZ52_ZASCE|nr:uncharacterized protein M409DRAFT_29692 [Zasmidium cellare ATCC 36951]KAF2159883.1 hypothetical protein M409DRAFT_29692 [Zasmidium cellare ATCC 36951]
MANILASDHLIYRAIEHWDAPMLAQLHQDTQAHVTSTPFLPTPQGSAIAQTDLANFERCLLAAMICIKAPDGQSPDNAFPIGIISLKDPNLPGGRHLRSAKLGINLLPEYQNQGYGTEAVRWCLEWGFKQAGLHKIGTYVYEHNVPSMKLCEKVGFKLDGRMRDEVWFDGRFWDDLAYSMLEDEWKDRCGD